MIFGRGWEKNSNIIKQPIALDAMGGDYAPEEPIKAALEASKKGLTILLVGEVEKIRPLLPPKLPPNLLLISAPQSIEFCEQPTKAILSKPDSSITVGLMLVKEGKASAFVSAGSTGAIVVASILVLGTLPEIERPALALLYPSLSGASLILDVGANADCRAEFLKQFAILGARYISKVMHIPNPTIGILSNGEEDGKGNKLVRESFKLLKDSGLNFIGNIEGKDLFRGRAHVIVTDGFTGNVLLKANEGFGEFLFDHLMRNSPKYRLLRLLLSPLIRKARKQFDYRIYGGAPLLGVKGNVVVAHGRSKREAILSAIFLALRMIKQGLPEAMEGG